MIELKKGQTSDATIGQILGIWHGVVQKPRKWSPKSEGIIIARRSRRCPPIRAQEKSSQYQGADKPTELINQFSKKRTETTVAPSLTIVIDHGINEI